MDRSTTAALRRGWRDLLFVTATALRDADSLAPRLRDRGAARRAPGADRAREPEGERDRHAPAGARRSPRRAPPTPPSPAARRSARSSACPSRTRTSCRRAASAPRTARRSTATTCPEHDGLIVERLQGGRRHHDRQDQHAGVRRRLADVQRGLRPHAEPVRPDQDVRRLERRRRGRARLRHGPDRRRQRHGRLAAQPGELLQRRRLPARRPAACPTWPSELGWVAALRRGADGAHGGGRRAAAVARWPGPIRARRSPSPSPATRFRAPARPRASRGVRVAWSRDLGGLPIDPRVTAVHRRPARRRSRRSAAPSRTASPTSRTRARSSRRGARWQFESRYAPLLEQHRHQMKDTVIWNIEQGQKLTGPRARRGGAQAHRALPSRARVHGDARVPDPARRPRCRRSTCTQPYVTEINGVHAADLHRLDARLLRHHRDRPAGDLRARAASRRTGCPWASRSSVATTTTGACCSSPTRSSRPRASGSAARRSQPRRSAHVNQT